MAQDIRDFFKDDKVSPEKMPANHEQRFIKKLDKAFPEKSSKSNFGWIQIAATITLLIGLSFGGYKLFSPDVKTDSPTNIVVNDPVETKSLGDISPGLKKVEGYYLASINLELSKIKYTPETKDLFDGYIEQLGELDKEYKRLSLELTKSGPSELTVNALIDNLKLRLNLLYRLKSQLKELTPSEAGTEAVEQSI
ncbi:hypothetical protein E1J38_006450 [Seonamhaeicola sediminis]|uniref:DUF4179 domain-containing protein n=1 Tax=Seonamhaeicola sediminis TaxID=2528206 RepID=A0A562YCY9_9FLAO|nr:hypothetical protein [Seonamhaeicola sediminis]TWO32511.1 hypothetical protein E1J38_006450 [Seonamhaeicola sediminis]